MCIVERERKQGNKEDLGLENRYTSVCVSRWRSEILNGSEFHWV